MKKKLIKTIILLLLIFIVFIIINYIKNYIYTKKQEKLEVMSITYLLDKSNGKPNIKEEIIEYEMILEIPKINLKKGILNKNDKDNNIEKNVTILSNSSYPNKEGNIYLAAHSGNGNKSFFNNLKKLKILDKAILYYEDIKYEYKVTEIKEISKTENISIITTTRNNLVLITCSQTNKSKYLIVILNKN